MIYYTRIYYILYIVYYIIYLIYYILYIIYYLLYYNIFLLYNIYILNRIDYKYYRKHNKHIK